MLPTVYTILSLRADFRHKRPQQTKSAEARLQTNGVTNPPLEGQQGGGQRVPEQRKSQPILPLRQNGFMAVDDPGHHDGLTYYAQSRPSPGRQPPARRQQSLPGRRMQGDDMERLANSAPSRKVRSLSRKAPLPQLNTLVAKSRGPGGETSRVVTSNFAGYSTKDQEASPTRYTRFASTWAQVRAENHIDMCAPVSPSQDKSPDRDHHSDWSGSRSGPGTGRTPDRQAHKDHSPPRSRMDHASHSPAPHSKDSYTRPSPHRKEPAPAHTKAYPHTKKKSREDREKQTIRFEDETGEDGDQQDGEVPTEAGDVLKPRSAKKRPDWDNRLALSVPIPNETPVKSWKRYEAELTHTPAITSTQEVYKAYTGCSKQQLRDKQRADNDMDMTELRPSTRSSQQTEDSGGPYRPSSQSPREYILTRNEAKMFLHLQNVYGSEAHRQQRKEWFFKKLGDVQTQELQQQAADKRRKKQQVEESKKRQKRQLMFVRRKFRKEQLHRFRTQYVTSRVLEYEKADRDIYGLPDESDDEGVDGFADAGDSGKEHPHTERSKTKDSFQGNKGSERQDSKTASERSGKGSQRHYEESEEDSRKANKNDKSVSGASKPNGFVGYTTEPSSDSTDISQTPMDDRNASTTVSKNSVQGNTGSKTVKTTRPDADKPVNSRTATKNLKQNPNNDHVRTNKGSDSKQKDTSSTNGHRNTSTNTHTNTATKTQKTSGDMAKTTQKDPVKSKTSKDAATTHNPNVVDTTTSSSTESPRAVTNTARNTAKTEDTPSENVSSLLKDRNMPTAATTTGSNNRTSAAQPAASSSTASGAKSQGTKTANESRQRNTETIGGKGAENSSPQKGNNSPEKNKNTETKKEKTISMNDNKENNTNQDKHNSVPNKRKDETSPQNKTNSITGNKQAMISHENKEPNVATSKDPGSKDSPRKTTLNTASSKDFKGHASDTSSKPTPNNPRVATVPETRDGHSKPSKLASNNPTVATVPETKDGHKKPSGAEQKASSRGQKRKPAQPHPKSEAEQKKQMERKYGKIFDVNTGPSWNPGAKPPKMEGIDTVLIKVTDDKGRTRLKKREVKDVVKEAKAQLAKPLPENRNRSGRKEDNSVQPAHNIIRSASADTLDFDEDEEDEEEEDVFERVRRKYNLQIDSDDDDSTV